jgi:allophanate hydrolase subunit 2
MPKSIISEPTMPGGVQIPPDEQPIILMVEQTVGGYTKIVTVISVDLPMVAQATPGDTIRFEKVSLETAHRLFNDRKERLRELSDTLASV